jgi:hypothetical protein
MSDHELVDAEVVEHAELVPTAAPSTLFRTDEPAEVLRRATDTANALKPVLDGQGMVQQIQGKGHVRVEGWTTLGAMLGVTPVCVWTRKLTNPEGWEARVEARTLDGRVIGAAEAQCLKEEGRWKSSEDYARRSMAQTRATSKALGSVLRFVVTLAGYSGTPAEEMDGVAPENGQQGQRRGGRTITEGQQKLLKVRAHKARMTDADLLNVLKVRFGVSALADLPMDRMDDALTYVTEPVPTGESDVPADMDGLDQPTLDVEQDPFA